MKPSEQAEMFCSFVAAIKRLCPNLTRILINNSLFSSVVMKLKAEGDSLASKICVLTRVTGYHCYDFEIGLTYAQSMGAVSLLSPDFTHVIVNLAPRQIKDYSIDKILPIAKAYLEGLGELC